MFTWSFRQFKRPVRDKRVKEDDKDRGEPKEVILNIPFQLDRDFQPNSTNTNSGEPVYRMRMQIL
jgi:hypothetical protein